MDSKRRGRTGFREALPRSRRYGRGVLMTNLNLEILHRIANGNTMAHKADEDFETSYREAQKETEVGLCTICGCVKPKEELAPDFICISCIKENA